MHQVRDIKVCEIQTSALNPRKTFDQTEIEELAQSIKENGLINAITLRKVKDAPEGIKYEVICGERRFRAVQFLGEETIQAVVKELNDKQAFACMVIENLQRKDIDPLEEAAALKYLYSQGEVPVKEIGKIIGKSVSFVMNRIQLNNAMPEFIQLLKDGIINLSHLQEIAKLTKEQQSVLLANCFQSSHIERWTFKTLSIEKVKEWIDEHVMCHISKARFNPSDETYSACKACTSCKFCTATRAIYKEDSENPRCMKQELFKAKNREAIIREAKDSNLPVVYAGSLADNKDIVDAAQGMHVYPQPLGRREYLVEPTPPSAEDNPNDPRYQKRLANYERVRGVFDENVASGVVIKVYEISYDGTLSGEVKFLFNQQTEEIADVSGNAVANAEKLTMYKTQLRAADEAKSVERVERQRAFMETSSYTSKTDSWNPTEENVFLALLVSRLPQEFRKQVGMDDESVFDVTSAFSKLAANKNAIMREFIRLALSDKSVSYSAMFASLLDITLRDQFKEDTEAIDIQLARDYESKCKDYEDRIAQLEAELNLKNETSPAEDSEVVVSEGETSEDTQEAAVEATEAAES